MITFTKLGEHGRLGNQLFQYALLRSVSEETGYPIQLPDLSKKVWHGQKCLLPELNIKYKSMDKQPRCLFEEANSLEFYEEVFRVQPDTDFFGHFQNPRYFEKYKNLLLEDFKASSDIVRTVKNILSRYTNPTSIHIRLGDYLEYSQNSKDYPNLVMDYIQKCMSKIQQKTDYLIFTGGSRLGNDHRSKDFEWCKARLKGSNIHFMEGNSELLDFELIKNCKNNITGWDSTFSWWASYLNETDGKIFCNIEHQTLPLYKHKNNWIVI